MDAPVEPNACYNSFSAVAGGLHYFLGGRSQKRKVTTTGIYDPLTEQWALQPTTGPPPPRAHRQGCVFLGNHLYCLGVDKHPYLNHLHKLNLETFHWSEVHPRNDPSEWPTQKTGCGVVVVDEKTLGCFGGYGNPPTKESSFIKKRKSAHGHGWTNELHLFDVQQGILFPSSITLYAIPMNTFI